MGPVETFRVVHTRNPNREGEFMRKLLVAVIAAAALFAVGAFAASFTVESEDVASGSDDVTACASNVDVNFTTTYIAAQNDWQVTHAVVDFYSDANGTAEDGCDGFDATVVIENVGGTQIADGTAEVGSGSANVPLDETIYAGAVGQASVLVDGQLLHVDPTPGV